MGGWVQEAQPPRCCSICKDEEAICMRFLYKSQRGLRSTVLDLERPVYLGPQCYQVSVSLPCGEAFGDVSK